MPGPTKKPGGKNAAPLVSDQTFNIFENSTDGIFVGTVLATDPEGVTLTYSIVGGSIVFAIDAATGQITVLDGSGLDYETADTWLLDIAVSDGDKTSVATITVALADVNEAPTAIHLGSETLLAGTDGVVIGTLLVTDPDDSGSPYGQHTYSLDNSLFEVENGQLKLAAGVTLAEGETASVTVTATDGGGLSTEQTFSFTATVAPPTTGVVSLGALDPSAGFTISGVNGLDFGGIVSNAGDVNGDGIDDFLAVEPTVTGAFLIYGRSGGFPDFSINQLALGTEGSRIFSLDEPIIDDVAGIGDINNDGLADIAIGSGYGQTGEVAIIYGKLGGIAGEIDFLTLSQTDGFVISESAGDTGSFGFGGRVAAAGDVNGDGIDDFIIGDATGDGSSRKGSQAGDAYIVYGKDSTLGGTFADFSIDSLGSGEGFHILGAKALDQLGLSVSSAGDINADGYDDVVVGALGARSSGKGLTGGEGISYVIYGGASGADVDLASFSPEQGFRIIGADPDDRMGRSVSNAGDVNGDGIDDIVIGADFADGDGSLEPEAGEAYIIFGSTDGFSDIDVGALSPGQGIRIVGRDAGDYTGIRVSDAGDVNGDGYDDVLIAAPWAAGANDDTPKTGEVYLLWGKEDLADIDLGAFSAADGIRFLGTEAEDFAGWAVSAAGDVNDDGFDDILIGAFGAEEAYVIYGAQDLTL